MGKLRTNVDRLVMVSVQGEVAPPTVRAPYRTGHDGVSRAGPGTGGITYNVRVGDPAVGWAGDHVEPGVSTKHKDELANAGYNLLTCVGNAAMVASGGAAGACGVVTGKHGGIEHVLIDFGPEDLDKLAIGDKIQVKGYGQGLELLDFPEIKVMNLDPGLLEAIAQQEGRKLVVPVTAVVPAVVMGSGLGAASAERGDYDITTQDEASIAEYGLDKLRLGDIVAIRDHSARFGRSYRQGAVTIGVVIHCDSHIAGHGPGVTCLLTADKSLLEPVVSPEANIARYLDRR